jgi:hypothetical protein
MPHPMLAHVVWSCSSSHHYCNHFRNVNVIAVLTTHPAARMHTQIETVKQQTLAHPMLAHMVWNCCRKAGSWLMDFLYLRAKFSRCSLKVPSRACRGGGEEQFEKGGMRNLRARQVLEVLLESSQQGLQRRATSMQRMGGSQWDEATLLSHILPTGR